MKASPRQQQLLLNLQDFDNSIARAHRKKRTLPEREALEALSGEASEARERFMEAQRALDGVNAEIERIEDDVRLVRERRDRDEQLLAVSTSSKEAQALQSELDTLGRRRDELEERELEYMEAQEIAQATYGEAERAFQGVDGRRAEIQAAIEAAEREIDSEVEALTDERAGLAAEIQRDLLGVYEELRGRVGIGAARLRGNVSEASNMALTPAELSGIRATAPDELVFCPGTGAILVRVEEEAD